MIKETEGIVLRNVKYGDSSLVSTIYTRVFGLQTYLLQGIRSERKSNVKANLYQPGNILELQVYHAPNKNMQRVREVKVHVWYQAMHRDMVRHSMLVFCIELFGKVVTQPETNEELFDFLKETLCYMDTSPQAGLTNVHLFFTLRLAYLMGFGIQDQFTEETPLLDLANGSFVPVSQQHSLDFLEGHDAEMISRLNQSSITDCCNIPLLREQRLHILHLLIRYLQLHVHSMGKIKSLEVLPEILS